jgi:DNA repair protein RadA/Sms
MGSNLEIIRMSEVQATEVSWLWHPYIPFGKITMIQGDPGDGKTMLVLTLSALLSNGSALPEQTAVNEPIVELLAQKKETYYTAETRCPSCKVYVGIKN